MKYFLFREHPKKEDLENLTKEKEERVRAYFKQIDSIEVDLVIQGETFKGIIDYKVFSNYVNFDCFNCVEFCCADNPAIYSKKTREFIKGNYESYNELTKNQEVLYEVGYEEDEILESLETDIAMVPEEVKENEIKHCSCSFKPDNSATLCSLHSIALDKGLSSKEIVEIKPIICSLWPLEIIAEDDESLLYVTIADDFTNSFTIEDYYEIPCINMDYTETALFRRNNPDGFKEEDFVPLIDAYGSTIRYGLGGECYKKIKEKLLEDELIESEEQEKVEQIRKKY